MADVETVMVQREKSEDNPTGLVMINKADVVEGDVVVNDDGTPAIDANSVVSDLTATTITANTIAPATTTEESKPAPEGETKPWAAKK